MAKRPSNGRNIPVEPSSPRDKPTRNAERSKYRYPEVFDLFWILICVGGTAGSVWHCLGEIEKNKDRIQRALRHREYEEPPRFSEFQGHDEETTARITAAREKLRLGQDVESRRNITIPAQEPSTRDLPFWWGYRRLDAYYEWRARLRHEIAEARQIVADVADQIDTPARGLLNSESAEILRALDRLSASLPGMSQAPYVYVDEPERFMAALVTAIKEIDRWVENLRSTANQLPPSGLQRQTPALQKNAPQAREDLAIKMARPILVAEAAHAINKRPDVVLRKLRCAHYTIGGPKWGYVVEFADLCAAYPRLKRRLTAWANDHFPPAE